MGALGVSSVPSLSSGLRNLSRQDRYELGSDFRPQSGLTQKNSAPRAELFLWALLGSNQAPRSYSNPHNDVVIMGVSEYEEAQDFLSK